MRCGPAARSTTFEAYVEANLGPELGSLANFGVFDADGRAVLFEIHNDGLEMIDPAEARNSCLVNTNYARSGTEGEGAGYLRFERATELFAALPDGPVDFRTILTTFTRDTGHVLVDQPTPFELRRCSGRPEAVGQHPRHHQQGLYLGGGDPGRPQPETTPIRWPRCGSSRVSR